MQRCRGRKSSKCLGTAAVSEITPCRSVQEYDHGRCYGGLLNATIGVCHCFIVFSGDSAVRSRSPTPWTSTPAYQYIMQVLRLRRENYFDKPAAPGNSFALIHHDFVLNRTDPAPNPPPVSVAVLYAITFDKARIPMNSFGSEYTATPSETCSVTFAIIASHTTGTLTLENSSPYLAGGTYHFEPNIENNDLSVQVIGSQEVCGSDIITDAVLDETDCISVHQNEEQPTRVVIQLPVLPSESARPHFYIVAVQATGSGSCYDKWLIPLDYEWFCYIYSFL